MTLSYSSLAEARRMLRASLRAQRRALSPATRKAASRAASQHFDRRFRLPAGARVALYASMPEEIDTTPLFELARRHGWQIYLPRIDRSRLGRRMRFVAVEGRRTRSNRLGIHEPDGSRVMGARWLDVVLVPLVGFDAKGMRIGMGAGYYDRAFAFRRWRTAWRGPLLVGFAYSLQQLPDITSAAHDVPLDAVITEKGMISCRTG